MNDECDYDKEGRDCIDQELDEIAINILNTYGPEASYRLIAKIKHVCAEDYEEAMKWVDEVYNDNSKR